MRLTGTLLMLGVLGISVAQTQEKKVELHPVKYDGLKQAILQQRGKVVLVDFWASFCLPCQKAFPHFIALHKKYADHGLDVITVSVDAADDPQQAALAQTFLRQVNAPFLNLHLQEPPEVWTKKLDFVSLPCYYVFDRQGKWVRFGGKTDSAVDYDALEKLLVRLLAEK